MNEELTAIFLEAKNALLAARNGVRRLNHWVYAKEVNGKLQVTGVLQQICYAKFRYEDHSQHAFIISDVGVQVREDDEVHEAYFQKIYRDSVFSKYLVHYEDGIAMLDLSKHGPSPIIATLIAFRIGTEYDASLTYKRLVESGVDTDVAMCLSWLYILPADGCLRAYSTGAHGPTEHNRFRVDDLATFLNREDGWVERPVREKGGEFTVHDFVSQRNSTGISLSNYMKERASTCSDRWDSQREWFLDKFIAEAIQLGKDVKEGKQYGAA